jgi:hypothetical protein
MTTTQNNASGRKTIRRVIIRPKVWASLPAGAIST